MSEGGGAGFGWKVERRFSDGMGKPAHQQGRVGVGNVRAQLRKATTAQLSIDPRPISEYQVG